MLIHGSTLALSVLCLSWTPTFLYDLLSCPGNLQRTLPLDGEPPTPETPTTTGQVKRVAIIGAGTAGLAALKTFIHDIPKPDGQLWEVELFERRNGLGGIWSVPRFFTHASPISADAFSNTGCKTTVQPGIRISQKHHSTHNCTLTHLLRRVITIHAFLNTLTQC
jgi:hypothetical protein